MKRNGVIVSYDGQLTVIKLNRPDSLNSIDEMVLNGLLGATELIERRKTCRAVIITGSGEKAFCAGADINYIRSLKNVGEAAGFVDVVHSVFDSIESLGKPVIAAINGYCLGGGCELALACDVRIATPESVFGQPEVRLGIIPGGGGTYRLPNTIGIGKAKEMILTGDTINAKAALRLGLISKIVDGKSLIQEAKSIALRICRNSPNAVKNAKLAVNASSQRNDDVEKDFFLSSFEHADRKEGIDAFLKKRKPRFR